MTIAITGANGSVGTILLSRLANRTDVQAVACVRSQRAAATLPQASNISTRVVDYGDREGLATAFTGAGCLVHLAGILMEGPTTTYQSAHVEATQTIVDACRAAGVRHVVLVSVLGADPDASNQYLSSKGKAERIVSASGLSATIIRTPLLLGPGTAGAGALVGQASRPAVPLLGGGRHVVRPLDVDDLSGAILNSCGASRPGVATHELVGPEAVAYRDLVARAAALMGRQVAIRSIPVWAAKLGATIAGLKKRGGMTPTVIDIITSGEDVHRNGDAELGVTLTPLSTTIEKCLPSRAKG
ncbi:MAG: NAD-dependent epimerase/dehydratase family protein [Acidimicrobiia bacterium]|nr:NAD-dependent epimerase/dehydratase family protein [Acidimicrobiia bacterium]